MRTGVYLLSVGWCAGVGVWVWALSERRLWRTGRSFGSSMVHSHMSLAAAQHAILLLSCRCARHACAAMVLYPEGFYRSQDNVGGLCAAPDASACTIHNMPSEVRVVWPSSGRTSCGHVHCVAQLMSAGHALHQRHHLPARVTPKAPSSCQVMGLHKMTNTWDERACCGCAVTLPVPCTGLLSQGVSPEDVSLRC
jgi:hypothetical protein